MKRLVVCADGTWNVRDQIDRKTQKRHATNVTKVARAILPRTADGIDQVVFYHDGVGTHWGLDRITGGAFGTGLESNIRELYRFLVYNYAAGDELFLFGFSRGAFTVRTLAGFMNRYGLLAKGDDFFVPDLYACYVKGRDPASIAQDVLFRRMRPPQPCPPIRFVGVWDTVGALGAPGFLGQLFKRGAFKYHDVALNDHIQNACHALAIDERRVPFRPNIWSRPAGWQGHLEQAWFAGVHCNVGGGYSPDGLANEALHWLVGKAERLGLAVDADYLLPFRPCFNSVLNDSMTLWYRAFGAYARPIGAHREAGEEIHRSVLDRIGLQECNYAPGNLPGMSKDEGALPVTDTTRIPRGTPCRAGQELPTPRR